MTHSWLTLVPPLLVITIAIITHRIQAALLIGIFAACFVASNALLSATIKLAVGAFWSTATNIDNLYLYAFLFAIGILVALFSATGFVVSFAQAITQKIRTARQAQYASMFVSTLLFIDDYLSILTTGYVMSPITDRFSISREKLAFLVHSCAGPIVILSPISSWVGAIISNIEQAGVSTVNPEAGIRIFADPFFLYLQTIPYMFYSIILISAVWLIITYNVSFGPMKKYDQKASPRASTSATPAPNAHAGDLLLPVLTLIIGIIVGMPFAGGYYLFGGPYSLIDSLKYNQHPFLVMLCSAIAAIIVTLIRAWRHDLFKTMQLRAIISEGFNLTVSAVTMVYLASTLSGLLANHVETGKYLSSLCTSSMPLFLLPAAFFIVSLACTIATGSAWGTFGIIIPIAIPMIASLSGMPTPIDVQAMPLLLPILGAIFSGAVCGNHVSPLADTAIMTATSCGTKPIIHSYTQFFYALPVIITTLTGYIMMGMLITVVSPAVNVVISLGTSLIVCLGSLLILNKQG